MTHVERFNAVMNFESVDRYPRIEWAGYWGLTTDRLRDEGLDASLQGAENIREHLGLDGKPRLLRPPRHLLANVLLGHLVDVEDIFDDARIEDVKQKDAAAEGPCQSNAVSEC